VVEGIRVFELYCVLAMEEEARDVEGSKVDRNIFVGSKVAGSGQSVQPGWNVDDELTIDENLELADAVVEIVEVEACEG